MRRSLTKDERLRSPDDFDRIFANGRRVQDNGVRLIYAPNGLGVSRIAVCPVKKYGAAVERNHGKRVCRETFRRIKDRLEVGYDLVFVLYPRRSRLSAGTIEKLCRQSTIWRG